MSYRTAARRRPLRAQSRLGDTSAILGTGVGTVIGGPAGGATGNVLGNLIGSLFGSSSTDTARKTRVAWTLQEANAGSTLAAALIYAAPANVAGDEAPYWRTALNSVRPDILAAAQTRYPQGYWPVGQPDFYTDVNGATHRQIVSEVSSAGGINTPVTSTSSGGLIYSPGAYPTTTGATRIGGMSLSTILIGAGGAFLIYRAATSRRRSR
jgi:hypothetical protein